MCPEDITTAGKSQGTEPLPHPGPGHRRLWEHHTQSCLKFPCSGPSVLVLCVLCAASCPSPGQRGAFWLGRGLVAGSVEERASPSCHGRVGRAGVPLSLSPADARCCSPVRNHLALNPGLHIVRAHSSFLPLGRSASGQPGRVSSGPG